MTRVSVVRRSPVLLLAAALAVLFAPGGQPAQAQTTTVWSATLTVQSVSTMFGCIGTGTSSCSDTAVLSDNDFTYEGVDYEVDQITYVAGATNLAFSLNKAIPASLESAWIKFDGVAMSLAGRRLTGLNADKFAIPRSYLGLTWTAGQTVEVILTFQAPPSGVEFASATYSGTEGDAITIELRLSLAQPEPVRFQVRPEYGSAADYWSDYSLGACSPVEDPCDFGVGILDVEIPAGEFSYSYDIRTEDDHRVEGDETFTLTVFPLSSNSEAGDTSQAVITITDNDEAGVVVSEEGITVDEDTSGSYTVKLTSQPDGYVAIYAESAFPCKVSVSPGFVELGPSNWNQPQTFVHVRAWHDYDAADEEVVISHRIEAGSRDAEYADVEVDSVTVNVTDKHLPGVIVETTSVEPGVGGTARYRVYLNADPSPIYGERPAGCYDYTESHTVTIEATSSDTNIATVSPASVTFTADDYDPKHFTVTGVSAGDVAITHAVSGTDPDYTDGTIIVQSTAVSVPALQQAPVESPSMPQEGATTEGVASPLPGPVLDVELTATADGLTVSWSAPETGDAPTRYIVHIMQVGGGKGATKTPKPSKTSVTFNGVEDGRTYKVFVRAKNKAGKGPRTYAIITLPELRPDTECETDRC